MSPVINLLGPTFDVAAESPTWAANLPLNTWEEMTVANGYTDVLQMTVAESGDPGSSDGSTNFQYNVVNALDQWSSMALRVFGANIDLYSCAAGGDGGHAGNNVFALQLNREQPRMVEVRASSQHRAASVTYADGRAPAHHHYNMPVYFRPLDQVFHVGIGPVKAPSAFAFDSIYSFDCGAADWDFGGGSSVAGVWPSLGLSASRIIGSAACMDETREVIWHHSNSGGNQLARFDPQAAPGSQLTTFFAGTASTHGFLVANETQDYMMVGGGGIGGGNVNRFIDRGDPGNPILLTNIVDASDGDFSDSNLWVGNGQFQDHIGHVVVNDTHVVLDNGGNIWTGPAPNPVNRSNPNADPWPFTRLGEAGPRPVLPAGAFGGGAYGRFRYLPFPNVTSGAVFVCVGRSGERPSVIKLSL